MKNSALARRYGKALFDVAKDKHAEQRIFDELELVINSIQENEDYARLIYGAVITSTEKKELIRKIYDGYVAPELVEFICVCIDKGRETCLEDIKSVYDVLWYEDEGIQPVYVSAAVKPDQNQIDRLTAAFAKRLNKPVTLIVSVDESLIGGISARVGDTIYDGSILGQLTRLSYQLHE